MKVIDLLNKIANKEIKDKTKFRIWFSENIYRDFYYDAEEKEELNCLKNVSDDYSLYDEISLNDEVEIIEEETEEYKKIEELFFMGESEHEKVIMLKDKLNEVINYINKEK